MGGLAYASHRACSSLSFTYLASLIVSLEHSSDFALLYPNPTSSITNLA